MTEQEFRELTAYQPSPVKNQPPGQTPPVPPPISPIPAAPPVEYPPINQAYQAPETAPQISPSYSQAAEYQQPIQAAPPSIVPETQEQPHGNGDELRTLYDRLHERYKHLIEERDELSRQVSQLRNKTAAGGDGQSGDYKEELRLLGKLIDDEQSLRTAAMEKGIFQPGEDPYARHDKLVNVFLGIIKHSE
ncbi:MAG: hypothetical protein LBK91_01585 [Synergistaceae bacterium]|jgi:hypothetical protein|nr:hypothetical protein [Synergistaceae bacterium]